MLGYKNDYIYKYSRRNPGPKNILYNIKGHEPIIIIFGNDRGEEKKL